MYLSLLFFMNDYYLDDMHRITDRDKKYNSIRSRFIQLITIPDELFRLVDNKFVELIINNLRLW